MNCRDTERLWNELLDDPRLDLDPAIEAHAATCPACARFGQKYRALRRAIGAWDSVPVGSPEFVDRLRNLPLDRPAARSSAQRSIPVMAWLSAAAAIVVAVAVGWRLGRVPAKPELEPTIARIAPRSISDAFADATSATLDLAWEASAPAGRVGRSVLDSTALPDADSSLSLPTTVVPTAEILRSVADRVGAGVRPLSSSARQAFGFMIRAATGDPGEHPSPVPPRGT